MLESLGSRPVLLPLLFPGSANSISLDTSEDFGWKESPRKRVVYEGKKQENEKKIDGL